MASIFGFGSKISNPDYLNLIKEFDVKSFEAGILLQLPLDVLLDEKRVNKILRIEVNRELQEMVTRVLLSKKEK